MNLELRRLLLTASANTGGDHVRVKTMASWYKWGYPTLCSYHA